MRVTPHKALKYCLKDGSIIHEEGVPPEEPIHKLNGDDKWGDIMEAGSRDEFLKQACKTAPRDSVLHFGSLLSYADWRYRDNPDEYVSPDYYCQCQEFPLLVEWVSTHLRPTYTGRRKSLVMYGGTLIGKTLWARGLGKHAYFPGLFMLEGFNAEEVEYAIFDDLIKGLGTIPDYKLWFGGQQEMVIGDKYLHKQRIRWGKPCIYIANDDPRLDMTKSEIAWLNKNCFFVNIDKPLADTVENAERGVANFDVI